MSRKLQNQKFSSNQRGALNVLLIPLILALLFFFAAAGFGYWAFTTRQTYKNHSDQLVATAVAGAKDDQATADAKKYNELEKQPLRPYDGPSAYGSVHVMYPKTWSAYVAVASDSGASTPVDGYFNPQTVPDTQNQNNTFALRVQVQQTPYSQALQQFNDELQQKTVTITPYSLPKVPSVVGVRIDGAIEQNKQGSMIVLPLRDTTLEIWTETQAEVADFNTYILPNFTFLP